MNSVPAAEFQDVCKTYSSPIRSGRAVVALRRVSFRVEPGEVFALLGPNRAGKTTLLKSLLGLCRPTSGRIYRLGASVEDRRTLAQVGYMHDHQAFPRYLSSVSLLHYYGAMTGISSSLLRSRVPEMLDRVGLSGCHHQPIREFSKGMVQRLALANALLGDPALLVLDEPLEGLDLTARVLFHEIVLELRDSGKSVIIASHELNEVATICDRVGVLVEGQLVHLSSYFDLLHNSVTGAERSFEEALEAIYRTGGVAA